MSQLHPLQSINVVFPEGVYADVRLERNVEHRVLYRDGELEDVQSTVETGALIRVLRDGQWLFASTTELDRINDVLTELALSRVLPPMERDVGVESLMIHRDQVWIFDDERIDQVPMANKLGFLKRLLPSMARASIRSWNARWLDQHRDRRFLSSRGADVSHDYQECGVILSFTMGDSGNAVQESFRVSGHRISDLESKGPGVLADLETLLDKCQRFADEATSIQAGQATVILSPEAAGIFAHESFGHKSEADTMLGDPQMLEDWKIGSRVAADGVSIIDGGSGLGSGYMPYDDEGQKTGTTHLIKNGLLSGRLHSALTAAALGESLTANARAMSFRFEPIVRMTTTTFAAGEMTKSALFEGVDDGYFIETVRHGSGMSTFTIAPGLCWKIRHGKLAEPVRIAVLTGTVFETLGEIDGLSDEVQIPFLVGGGCGKLEQWPLSVGFGGPYVRVRRMNVS